MADFDDFRPARGSRDDKFTRQVAIVAVVLGLATLVAFFAFMSVGDDESTSESGATTEKVEEPPTPEPTPEPTPTGPPSHAVQDPLHVLAFSVNGTLSTSIKAALPDEYDDVALTLSQRLAEALRWRVNPRRDLRKGDTAWIVFNPNAKTERAPLYGFRYHSKRFGKDFRFVYFPQAKGVPSPFFDAEGNNVAQQITRSPLDAGALTQAQIVNLGSGGLRYLAPRGTKVVMPFPARVMRLNWDQDNLGRSIEVRYLDSSKLAWFCHLDTISDQVKEGAILGSGTSFATVGQTGKATRPLLLYRTFAPSEAGEPKAISPYEVHGKENVTLAAADRVAFVAVMAKIDKLFALVEPAAPADAD
jgi:Peptidase family M23